MGHNDKNTRSTINKERVFGWVVSGRRAQLGQLLEEVFFLRTQAQWQRDLHPR